jgi:hypothetical protein
MAAISSSTSPTEATKVGPAYQAYRILQIGFVVAPIVAGLDKFTGLLTDWEQYLAPFIADAIGAGTFMAIVGVIEIAAGIGVAIKPRIFAYVVSAWLVGIIINLLLIPGFYDIALRDLGLALGALALGRLSETYS